MRQYSAIQQFLSCSNPLCSIVGDAPFPIQIGTSHCKHKHNQQQQLIICADTSYSGDTEWMSNDNNNGGRENLGHGNAVSGRGDVAVSEILLEQCIHTGSILDTTIHGVLSDGTSYESVNFQEDSDTGVLVDCSDLFFEGNVEDASFDEMKWHVKSKFEGQHECMLLISAVQGRKVFNSIAKREKVHDFDF